MFNSNTQPRTALVTGAAAGLGSKFAERLTRDGIDVILVDRQAERAQVLANELARNYRVRTYVIAQDLCDPCAAASVRSACDDLGLTIDILINNAGLPLNKCLIESSWPDIRDNVHLLLGVVVQMCHSFLPPMIERGWGRIINVSSVSGFMPGGMRVAIYNAAKSFLIPFSEAIGQELEGTGVQVTALCPGFMKTEVFARSGLTDVVKAVPGFMWVDPARVADEAIRAVMNGVPVHISGWPNRMIVTASKFVPRALFRQRTRVLHAIATGSLPTGLGQARAASAGNLTALVTGASAGIGASFSELLARRGFDVVLVARRGAILQRRAAELSKRYGVRAHVIVQDLTEPRAAERIAAECERLGWPIDVLINNAAYPVTELFHQMLWPEIDAALNILVKSVVELTWRIVPKMVERGSGKVINVASMAGFQPGTYRSSIYCSSKAFVIRFSESVAAELEGTGVTVTAVCPGYTKTEWFGKTALDEDLVPGAFWMASDRVAEAGFEAAQRADLVTVVATPVARGLFTLFQIAPRRLVGRMISQKRRSLDH